MRVRMRSRTQVCVSDGMDLGAGFSLVELMMVVAVLGVLMAIAVPTLLGARTPAQDKQATTILHTSMVAARIGASDTGDYVWVTPSALGLQETSLHYLNASTTARAGANQVSVGTGTVGSLTYVILATRSASGRCFALLEQAKAAETFQAATVPLCSAAAFDPATGWTNTW